MVTTSAGHLTCYGIDMDMTELIEAIQSEATRRLHHKLKHGEIDDPKIKAWVAETIVPWVDLIRSDKPSITEKDVLKIAESDQLMMRRVRDRLQDDYSRLLKQETDIVTAEKLADLVSRGELIEEVDPDGETYFMWPDQT